MAEFYSLMQSSSEDPLVWWIPVNIGEFSADMSGAAPSLHVWDELLPEDGQVYHHALGDGFSSAEAVWLPKMAGANGLFVSLMPSSSDLDKV